MRIETRKCLAIIFALAQDRKPGKSSLGSLESEELEEPPVIMRWAPPLSIVIGDIGWIAFGPTAAAKCVLPALRTPLQGYTETVSSWSSF